MSFSSIPLHEAQLEIFEVGSFDTISRGDAHSKTCPHTIFAQAEQGRYEVTCGDGRHVLLATREAFLTGANVPLRIVHRGDKAAGQAWRHIATCSASTMSIMKQRR